MQVLLQDIRYALRSLAGSKVFTLAVLVTLAIAIGINTATFSIVKGILFPERIYKEPDQLIVIRDRVTEINYQTYEQWLRDFNFFESIGGSRLTVHFLTENGETKRLVGFHVTSGLFNTLGVQPLMGRTFLPQEDLSGAPLKVVLSEALWSSSFGRDPNIIGKMIRMNSESYEVIGVMPANFQHPIRGFDPPCWTSLGAYPRRSTTPHYKVFFFARLKKGMTLQEARSRVQAVAARTGNPKYEIEVRQLYDSRPAFDDLKETGFPVFAVAVLLVLLIACANIANLFLARGVTREKEIALRMALGANRSRLIRQLVTETSLLCLIGGVAGFILLFVFRNAFFRYASELFWLVREAKVNGIVLFFCCALSLLTGFVTGLFPALHATGVHLFVSLKESGQSSGSSRKGDAMRSTLVLIQIALSLALLTGAGLMFRSFRNLQNVELGFNPNNLYAVSLELPRYKYPDDAAKQNFYRSLLTRLQDISHISTGVTTRLPMDAGESTTIQFVEGASVNPDASVAYCHVSPTYLQTLGAMLLSGRHFTQQDHSAPVVIINQKFAERFWPGKSAIGKRIQLGLEKDSQRQVIGVIRDMAGNPDEIGEGQTYLTFGTGYGGWLSIVARSNLPESVVVKTVKDIVRSINPDHPFWPGPNSFYAIHAEMLQQKRAILLFVILFAIAAVILAAVGTYGVLDHYISRKQQEIGVRISIGAGRRDILKLVFGHGFRIVFLGIALGLILCFSLNKILQAHLYGVTGTDTWTYVFVTTFLFLIATIACLIPAKRAMSVDPISVLKAE